MDCSVLGIPALHHVRELTQSHVHWAGDAIQPSHPLLFPSPPVFNLSQHQGLVQSPFSLEFPATWSLCVCMCVSHWVMSNPFQSMDCSPPGLLSTEIILTRILARMGCHLLPQEIFPIQGLNPCLQRLLHWQVDSWLLEQPGEPYIAYKL